MAKKLKKAKNKKNLKYRRSKSILDILGGLPKALKVNSLEKGELFCDNCFHGRVN